MGRKIHKAIDRRGTTRHTFKAFDGEAIDSQYCLLASNTAHIWSDSRLSTQACLDFLFAEAGNSTQINVFYAMHYDVINMLLDVSDANIQKLNKTNECYSHGYKISYFPRKILTLTKNRKRRTFFDVSGFWQTSYERAIKNTLNLADDTISKGKAERASFTRDDKAFMVAYNARECETLVDLVTKLEEITNDFKMKSWHGASAISNAVLATMPSVKSNREVSLSYDNEIHDFIESGYYGGHIEALRIGRIAECVSYDIVSAYPSAMRSIRDIERLERSDIFSGEQDGIYAIRFYLGRSDLPCPFPVRHENRIFFPSAGSTVVTGHELSAWYSHYSKHFPNSVIQVISGVVSTGAEYPLRAEVERLFAERRKLKASKDERQMAYKLALNSMYGKFAQRVGKPKYAIPFWAAQITGHCRAEMIRLASVDPSAVVSFATDSICYEQTKTIESYSFDCGTDLGQLEQSHNGEDIRILQSGLYKWSDGSEAKVRGFRGLDFESTYADIGATGYAVHNAKFLVGFNPPKSLLSQRGAIIDFPKKLRLSSNLKRRYSFDGPVDINATHYTSTAWPTLTTRRMDYNSLSQMQPDDMLDLVEL